MITNCVLVVDSRERHVTRHEYEFREISWKKEQITTGDYAVLGPDGAIMAIFERKSLDDFGASIKDGRHQNKQKLVELRNQTGCKIIYIIEGPMTPDANDTFSRIPYKHIESAIFHLMIRENICVWKTKSTLETAQFLARFVKSMDTLSEKMEAPEQPDAVHALVNGGEDAMLMLKRKQVTSDQDIVREMWSCFRGITVVSADEFIKRFSLTDIICKRVTGDQLAECKTASGRKVGRKAVESLINIDKHMEVRLLSKVPGISSTTATEIINNTPLPRLLTYSAGAIAMIKVGKTQRNLGEVRAKEILKYFSYKFDGAAIVNVNNAPGRTLADGANDTPQLTNEDVDKLLNDLVI